MKRIISHSWFQYGEDHKQQWFCCFHHHSRLKELMIPKETSGYSNAIDYFSLNSYKSRSRSDGAVAVAADEQKKFEIKFNE